jgi:hypothetical protein
MEHKQGEPLREYVGKIHIGDQPPIPLRLTASSLAEARAMVVDQYGEGHIISLWNEEDAASPR